MPYSTNIEHLRHVLGDIQFLLMLLEEFRSSDIFEERKDSVTFKHEAVLTDSSESSKKEREGMTCFTPLFSKTYYRFNATHAVLLFDTLQSAALILQRVADIALLYFE